MTTTQNAREVFFVGSVPLKPASAVFETLADKVGDLVARLPDGEQAGWIESIFPQLAAEPAFAVARTVQMGEGAFDRNVPIIGYAPGRSRKDVQMSSFGIADNALNSYAQFKALKDAGRIPPHVRFQATVPAPLTCAFLLADLPPEEIIDIAQPIVTRELERIVAGVPAEELAIQIDLAVEIGREEDRAGTQPMRSRMSEQFRWSRGQSVGTVRHLAGRVPEGVEFGIHLCGSWHVDTRLGQDMSVHVGFANDLAAALPRSLTYLHAPTIPEHDAASLEPLKDLDLKGGKLQLGVIHKSDGLEGSRRRIDAAERWTHGFGVAHWCGLSQWGAGPDTVAPMLDLHRQVALG